MITFIIGVIILFIGGYFYSKFVEKSFQPDDRKTPAVKMADGVDYVGMPKWKNSLIQLLNVAGTGPILGPIQGILFGPIAFLTIPIGCVIAGATHDYYCGMVSMRNNGAQMPGMVRKYLGNKVHSIYLVILMVLMILTGVVFVYTPGDLIVGDILGMDKSADQAVIWIVYGLIFIYYLVATLFPIDKIIGRIYPVFGAILVISAVGVFLGVVMDGGANLKNFDMANPLAGVLITGDAAAVNGHPLGLQFIPIFFITVACGIMSGFHGSQTTLIARTVRREKEGRTTFYMMMILEGFIAMCWAAGAMVLFNRGIPVDTGATGMVGIISREFLGSFGGILAILGVIILPITSGDTAFRAVRLMIAERLNISQQAKANRLKITIAIFIPAILLLFFAKSNANGFNLLWRYFGFTNQFVAVFALTMITVYLMVHTKNYWITLVPAIFYTFIVMTYISNAQIGFGLEARLFNQPGTITISYAIGVILALAYAFTMLRYRRKVMGNSELMDIDPH
ncbi:MAG: carbon starvation protein A [Anaerovoracaceae bacterium]|jgi:carbon starvation protein CstA